MKWYYFELEIIELRKEAPLQKLLIDEFGGWPVLESANPNGFKWNASTFDWQVFTFCYTDTYIWAFFLGITFYRHFYTICRKLSSGCVSITMIFWLHFGSARIFKTQMSTLFRYQLVYKIFNAIPSLKNVYVKFNDILTWFNPPCIVFNSLIKANWCLQAQNTIN